MPPKTHPLAPPDSVVQHDPSGGIEISDIADIGPALDAAGDNVVALPTTFADVDQWIDARCTVGNLHDSAEALRLDYVRWAAGQGETPLPSRLWGAALTQRGHRVVEGPAGLADLSEGQRRRGLCRRYLPAHTLRRLMAEARQ